MKTRIYFLLLFLISGLSVWSQNPRNTLIERGSSTWCDECICIDSLMQHCVQPAYPNSIVLIYHTNFSALKCAQCDTIVRNVFKDHSEIRTNRDGQKYVEYTWGDYHRYCDSVKANIERHTDAPVRMVVESKTYNSGTRTVAVTLKMQPYQESLTGTFMINAVLLENNILVEQSMDSNCYNYSGRRPCYHHDVVRNMAYQFGQKIKENSWPVGEEVTQTFSFPLESNYDPQNCFVVVYVYRQAESLANAEVQQAVIQSVSGPLGDREGGSQQLEIVKLFPNPANGEVHINFRVTEKGFGTFTLLDMQGKAVVDAESQYWMPGIYSLSVNTSSLPSGQYILRSVFEGKSYQKPLTILNNR